jgi:hypothetical protein
VSSFNNKRATSIAVPWPVEVMNFELVPQDGQQILRLFALVDVYAYLLFDDKLSLFYFLIFPHDLKQ